MTFLEVSAYVATGLIFMSAVCWVIAFGMLVGSAVGIDPKKELVILAPARIVKDQLSRDD